MVPARRYLVSVRGVEMVPAQPSTRCPPEHLPSGIELDLKIRGGLRRGQVWDCPLCYLGGHVGLWRWDGRRYVPFGSDAGANAGQTANWLARMTRGATAAEAEAMRAVIERVPASRRRRLLAQ
jgi:hypothetical protein